MTPNPKRPGRPLKDGAPRNVRREIRMTADDANRLDALHQDGETRNDTDLRVLRAGLTCSEAKT